MERIVSTEERIRRAEEIYARRKGNKGTIATVNVNNKTKKDIKLLKKMGIQIIICILIYLVVYAIINNEYIFSKDFRDKLNSILSYDTNFSEIYENIKNQFKINPDGTEENNQNTENAIDSEDQNDTTIQNENQEETQNSDDNQNTIENSNEKEENTENAIGGSDEISESKKEDNEELSQQEQEIEKVRNTSTFINPIEGTISSKFGQREKTSANIPTNHTGIDIAANMGTKIKSATDGEVVLVSEEGDFGKHIKVQIGEVSIIYAHCNNIYVNQGDQIKQGQEIGEVGSTGNSTGPHLHFEVRLSEKPIDPQNFVNL